MAGGLGWIEPKEEGVNVRNKVDVVDIWPEVGGYGSGHSVVFEFEGMSLRYEVWATDNASGSDIYVHDTNEIFHYEDEMEDETELIEFLDEVVEAYGRHYEAIVNPALEQAVAKTLIDIAREDR